MKMRVHLDYNRQELIERGPTIDVLLSIDGSTLPGFPDYQRNANMPALIDTGATGNAIDGALANALRLPIIDLTDVSGIEGTDRRPVHLARIYVPSLDHTIFGRFTSVNLGGGDQPYLVILGRTFLANFSMAYIGQTGDLILDEEILRT